MSGLANLTLLGGERLSRDRRGEARLVWMLRVPMAPRIHDVPLPSRRKTTLLADPASLSDSRFFRCVFRSRIHRPEALQVSYNGPVREFDVCSPMRASLRSERKR